MKPLHIASLTATLATNPTSGFAPLKATADVLGYRTDASYLDLIDAADLRQTAVQQLLDAFSALDTPSDFDAELSGIFLAASLLSADARALYDAAHECQRREMVRLQGVEARV